jgi:hypothetical protein
MTKKINHQNWLERDDTLSSFVQVSPTGTPEPISGQAWADLMLQPQLLGTVPKEVQRLFEGARGALIYGYFYYALCIMGAVALFRVAEAALAYKCKALNAPKISSESGSSFDAHIQWLASQGIVRPADWQMIAAARDSAAHPQIQDVITILEQVTEQINALFPAQRA